MDPSMKTFELSDRKLINDIFNKFQFKKNHISPLYDDYDEKFKIDDVNKM